MRLTFHGAAPDPPDCVERSSLCLPHSFEPHAALLSILREAADILSGAREEKVKQSCDSKSACHFGGAVYILT